MKKYILFSYCKCYKTYIYKDFKITQIFKKIPLDIISIYMKSNLIFRTERECAKYYSTTSCLKSIKFYFLTHRDDRTGEISVQSRLCPLLVGSSDEIFLDYVFPQFKFWLMQYTKKIEADNWLSTIRVLNWKHKFWYKNEKEERERNWEWLTNI